MDDDPNLLSGLRRRLHGKFDLVTAEGSAAALDALQSRGPFSVVVADMQMPEMNGVDLLDKLRVVSPDTVRIMLTGNADQTTAAEAINRGAVFRFLNKPCDAEALSVVLREAIRQHELITAEKTLLSQTLRGSVKVMIDLLGMVDPASHARALKLRGWVSALCGPLEIDRPWEVEIAAMLAPLAFMSLPASVRENADRPSRLTPQEKQAVVLSQSALHTLVSQVPRMEGVAEVLQHTTTRFDGGNVSGSPVRGSRLPMGSRLLHALHDIAELEAQGMTLAGSIDVLTKLKGKHDPAVLDAIDRWLTTPSERVPTAVTVRELVVGQVLAADARDKDGRLLLSKDQAITEVARAALWNHHALGQLAEPIYVFTLKESSARAA